MKTVLIAVAVLTLSACMSQQEQAEKIEYCRSKGLYPDVQTNADGQVIRINCMPEKPRNMVQESIDTCKQKGGVPILSSWDGRLNNCLFKEGK